MTVENVIDLLKIAVPVLVALISLVVSLFKLLKKSQQRLMDQYQARIDDRDRQLVTYREVVKAQEAEKKVFTGELTTILSEVVSVIESIEPTVAENGKKTRQTVRRHALRVIESLGATPKEVVDDND